MASSSLGDVVTTVFDVTAEWLLVRALNDDDLRETVKMLTCRLIDGGIPISRLVLGRSQIHPLVSVYDLQWDAETGDVSTFTIPRDQIDFDMVKNTPFGSFHAAKTEIRADLTNPEDVARFEIFSKLRDQGATDYAAWTRGFDHKGALPVDPQEIQPGSSLSVCTNRNGGFSDAEISGFEKLLTPLFLCVRMSLERYLARELLETYLGRSAGRRVYSGESTRGDVETITCVLFYSDMRGSSALSQRLSETNYIAALNGYFDCVAGAVLDHGGEVLKFVGDGVLAIFPIVEDLHPASDMCAAALSAAKDAFARAAKLDDPREFGVALHVGNVVYGNVGTTGRLDYTATGPAVALTCRSEPFTRSLATPIVSTAEFAAACPAEGRSLGAQDMRGFDQPVELFGWA